MPQADAPQKPSKPRPDFPLYAHASGRWAKKIRQKTHFFGPWGDPDKALANYLDQKDDLQAGRKPRKKTGRLNVRDLLNEFLRAKQSRLDAGELSPRTWNEYRQICDDIRDAFGLTREVADLDATDFRALRDRLAKKLGPVALGNRVQRARTVFRFAYENHLIDAPVRFGSDFTKPSRKTLRLARHAAGPKTYSAAEITAMLAVAKTPLRAFILLGVQAGFGPTDIATLPRSSVDLESGWITYPRPKTGIFRRVPLWQETRDALSDAFEARPAAKDPAGESLAFLTRFGRPYVRNQRPQSEDSDPESFTTIDAVAGTFSKTLTKAGIENRGFYSLRRCFETVAGESRDQPAVDAIMGHVDESMAAVYRQGISDERLRAVVDHVRAWLFG